MTVTTPVYERIARRETHSPRSVLAVMLATILVVVLAWIGTEVALAIFGLPALLVAPADMFTSAVELPAAPGGIVAAAGIILALIGLLLVIVAVSPGRRARHVLEGERAVTVVDNEVIAFALARHASHAGNVGPDNTTVSVSRRRALVHLTPSSGVRVSPEEVTEAVTAQLDSYGLRPPITARVLIAERGTVGA